ncbi:arrestin domain containing protein [Zalerion maritima]|uniref:Arrestin domain containing protein n=1 Tax=Zalerion maritima TaxID=339359 RepID=A0AAD5RY91_9PEZI|nr:arrestin domain containing protein [Zalerion maritima]
MPEAVSSGRPNRLREADGLTSISSSSTATSTVFYAPRNPNDSRAKSRTSTPRFPTPHIRPRQRRPHSIHIVSYPSGYVPYDLRPQKKDKKKKKKAIRRKSTESDQPAPPPRGATKRVWETLLAPFACQASREGSPSPDNRKRPSTATPSLTSRGDGSTSFEHQHEHQHYHQTLLMMRAPTTVEAGRPPVVGADSTAISLYKTLPGIISTRNIKSSTTPNVTEIPKPIASGSGVSCSILLAEHNIFLTGFDHDGRNRGQPHPNSTALLRGKLQLNVSKNVKIKSVTLKLSGRARTEWPEGIPPAKTEMFEESSLRTQVLTFFHALHDGWETPFGNQCVAHLKNPSPNSSPTDSTAPLASFFGVGSNSTVHLPNGSPTSGKPTPKELKRLSLQSMQAKNYHQEMSPAGIRPSAQVAKGFKVFHPGTYEYSFELPIDHHQLETTILPFGSVKWELETIVERAGAFKPNLHGTKEVSIVRVPDQLSLETTEPIVIGRQWEDQLHYEIMISGKSFPIGSRIPVAFKLTPLAKVQVHKLKVFVTESIEYWTNDRRVTRKDQGRKILLLEKAAGKPLDNSKFPGCDIRVLSGGELSPGERQEARHEAARRRSEEGESSTLPELSDNMLGDLDLGLESFWGSTEIEMNVQVPSCDMMKKAKNLKLNPDCSWKNVNVFHWIKIVMRISRVDEDDPTRQRRRHFEISIDSPITLLNCRATQANTSLPRYLGPNSAPTFPSSPTHTAACGCPDAGLISAADLTSLQLSTRVGTSVPRPIHFLRKPSFTPPAFDAEDPPPPISPLLQQANTASPTTAANSAARSSRNITPTSPAPIDPPLVTPPPCYDAIIGTPSVDGLADYFARLADYEDDDDDSSSSDGGDSSRPARLIERSGRVNVANPMSPGGLALGDQLVPSRSLELQRPVMLALPQPRRRG